MPTLDWIGKKAVLNHHREIPYRLLKSHPDLSAGDPEAGNLLVEGDNLHALKALLPYYAGKVKCIYIDPPYNTGNEGWVYNDAVNSPEMRAWLGKVVGKEAEDLSRHDKWLCMMYPRLSLLREFLTEDGVFLVSISDEELGKLTLMLNEIFGETNSVCRFIWVNEGNIDNQSKIKINHEYVVCFAKNIKYFGYPSVIDPNIDENSKLFKERIYNTLVKNGPKNPVGSIHLPAGFPADFAAGRIEPGNVQWPQFDVPIIVENWKLVEPVTLTSGWSSKSQCEQFINGNFREIIDRKGQETKFMMTRTGAIYVEKKRAQNQSHVLTVLNNMGTVQGASTELEKISINFDYPKPLQLIRHLLRVGSSENCIVLDSFAGSGSTAHAVIEQNKSDNGNRKFIIIEMDGDISRNVTKDRLTKVIGVHEDCRQKALGFQYCTLDEPLFDERGNIRTTVTFPELAAHVFFTETGSPLPKEAPAAGPLLGDHKGVGVYLLFNGILGDRRPQGGNVLTADLLAALPVHDGPKVIYGEGCRLGSARLKREGVIFRQIPYQIAVR